MSTKRIRHTAKFKFQIALEAIKSDKTINQLASDHQLHRAKSASGRNSYLNMGAIFSLPTPPSTNASKMTESLICMSKLVG